MTKTEDLMNQAKEIELFFSEFDELIIKGEIDEELKKIENLKPVEEIKKEIIFLDEDDEEWKKYRMLLQLYKLEEEQEYQEYHDKAVFNNEGFSIRERYLGRKDDELLYSEVVVSLLPGMQSPDPLSHQGAMSMELTNETGQEPVIEVSYQSEFRPVAELREVYKESGDIIPGFRLAESYSVSYDDLLHSVYELPVFDRTGHGYVARTIAGNSAMAIMDRKLRERGLEPNYEYKAFTADGKTIEGIELVGIESYDIQADAIFGNRSKVNGYFGFLFFAEYNGQRVEPEFAEGKQVPMDEYIPKPGEKIDLAVAVEGEYDGSYSTENKFCALPMEDKRDLAYRKAA